MSKSTRRFMLMAAAFLFIVGSDPNAAVAREGECSICTFNSCPTMAQRDILCDAECGDETASVGDDCEVGPAEPCVGLPGWNGWYCSGA